MEVTLVPTLAQANEAMGAAGERQEVLRIWSSSWFTSTQLSTERRYVLPTNLQTDAGWT